MRLSDCWLWRLLMVCNHSQLLKEWTQAPGQVEQSRAMPVACSMSFLYGCQLGSWLKVLSSTPLAVKKLRGFEKDDKATYFWVFWKKQNQCATGWHNGAIFIAMKMSTITAGSAGEHMGHGESKPEWWCWEHSIPDHIQVCFLRKFDQRLYPRVKWYLYRIGKQGVMIWKKNGKASYWVLVFSKSLCSTV